MHAVLALLAVLLALPASAAERSLTITDFDEVRVEGPFRVEVVTGRGSSGRVIGPAGALGAVRVTVDGRRALVQAETTNWGERAQVEAGTVVVRLSTHDLKSATLSGSGSLRVDRMRGSDRRVMVDGAGSVEVAALDADRIEGAAAGSGTLRLAGRVATAALALRGSAAIAAPDLSVADLTLASEGSGSAIVSATRSATVKASGTGSIMVYGKAGCSVENSGSGSVLCGKALPPSAVATTDPGPTALPRVQVGVPPQLRRRTGP